MPRAALALLLALLVLAVSGAPHVHAGVGDRHECIACATALAGAAPVASAGVAPAFVPEQLLELVPGLAPVTGAPQGAVPGQSPPSA